MEINGERVEGEVPSLFTKINIHYELYGDLDPKKAERAIQLSVEKYCSVGKIIEKTAEITWSYEIVR
jgi:putative redox protein